MEKVYFYVKTNDPELNGDSWVVFATEDEIQNDCICGEVFEIVGVGSKVNLVDRYVADDGVLHEDYLLHPTSGVTDTQIKNMCKSFGFIEDSRLDGCGWG